MNVENVEMFQAEDKTLTLHARGPSNLPLNLSGKTLEVRVGWPPLTGSDYAWLTKAGTITDAAAGVYTVALDAADTLRMAGDYEYQARATTGVDVSIVGKGRFRVRPSIGV